MRRLALCALAAVLVLGMDGAAIAKPGGGGGGGGGGSKPKTTFVQLSTSSLSVPEGGTGTINIKRSGDVSCSTTVTWSTTDVSAEPGDYAVAPASPVVFGAKERGPKMLTITGNPDADGDDDVFTLAVSAAATDSSCTVAVVMQAPIEAAVFIMDDDDADGDGVADAADLCPGTGAGLTVDSDGCTPEQRAASTTLDDDADGVVNASDLCPGTPAGTAVDSTGCAASPPPPGSGVFTVEPGQTATLTNLKLASCDLVELILLEESGPTRLFNNSGYDLTYGCRPVGFADEHVVNSGSTPLTFRLVLSDQTCAAFYDSDGTGNADHASIIGAGPWHVAMTDSGGPPEVVDADCAYENVSRVPESDSVANFTTDVVIAPTPAA